MKMEAEDSSSSSSSTTLEHVLQSLQLGTIPAMCMLLFTLVGLGKSIPSNIAGALQHFAAGILLCTIGAELLPEIIMAKGVIENLAMTLGFFLGVATLILLGIFMPEEEEGDDDEEEEEETEDTLTSRANSYNSGSCADGRKSIFDSDRRLSSISTFTHRKTNRQSLIAAAKKCYNSERNTLEQEAFDNLKEDDTPTSNTESSLLIAETKPSPNKAFPTTLLTAIAIDSLMDGLLIGIASVASPSAGPMMSLSLTVEMSFLGLTLATALSGYAKRRTLPASLLGPIVRKYYEAGSQIFRHRQNERS